MISIDRKIVRAILRLTDNYHDEMAYDPSTRSLALIDGNYHPTSRQVPVDVPSEDVRESIQRLVDKGYLVKTAGWIGGYAFRMTSLLKHRRAFWLDRFTKKFWGGFVFGVITGATAALVGEFLIRLLL